MLYVGGADPTAETESAPTLRPDLTEVIGSALDRSTVETAPGITAALDRLDDDHGCVVGEYDLPDGDGIELLETVRDSFPSLPFVLIDRAGDPEVAADAIAAGVTGYVPGRDGTGSIDDVDLIRRLREATEVESHRSLTRAVDDVYGDDRERERELRRYETIVEALDDAVYAVDRNGRAQYVNERYCEMKGVPREEILGTPMETWADDEETERIYEVIEAFERGRRDDNTVEYEFRAADGERIPAELRFARIEFPDGDDGRVGVIRDISDRKRRELELEEKNERLDAFASAVSHDLRSPLNVVQGRLRLAADEYDDEDLGHALAALERALDLIDDVLTLSREGDAATDPAELDVGAVARDSWETVETGGATLEIADDGIVEADPGGLRRALENLFRNSVEHGSTGSRTESDDSVEHSSTGNRPQADNSAERSSAGDRTESDNSVERSSTGNRPQADNSVEHGSTDNRMRAEDALPADGPTITVGTFENGFFVEDDGPGIPSEARERVFDAGYSTDPDGTGFGLNIVEKIADAHGWGVSATDADSGGARFEFTGTDPDDC